jgi:transposase-like protein
MTKRYSAQFKAAAVEQVYKKAAGQTRESIAISLGISVGSLDKWLASDRLINGRGVESEHQRIQSLEAEVKHLKEVNEILKKASAYFARHQK